MSKGAELNKQTTSFLWVQLPAVSEASDAIQSPFSSFGVTQISKLSGQMSAALSPKAEHGKDPESMPQVRKED